MGIHIHLYPVMDGLEMAVTGTCAKDLPEHRFHTVAHTSQYLSAERLDQHDLDVVLGTELTLVLAEYGEIADRARC